MSLLSRLAVTAARAYGILSSNPNNVSATYLVVAGGGSGGANGSGGGGAGGYQTSTASLSTLNTYSITVGAGGASVSGTSVGNNGSNSVISGTGLSTITSIGGGAGGYYGDLNGRSGGSGGGGGAISYAVGTGGSATSGQGNAGGNGYTGANYYGGGGGGAGAVGANATSAGGGNGGVGLASSISGTSTYYAGGGGGAGDSRSNPGGSGGNGGGGASNASSAGVSGTANTGGGGGAGGYSYTVSGAGGSGIVIISYTSATPKFVGGTITTSGGKQIHTFTSSGTLSPITPITASYLVVAGGGGGGRQYGGQGAAGGGGAGGLLTNSTTLYSGATYVVTVGAGGAGGSSAGAAPNGSDSVISGTGLTTLTATGGGGGAGSSGSGASGGSGGGGQGETAPKTGGSGTSGQGNAGGAGVNAGGGGGGASAAGTSAVLQVPGVGGAGTASSISGSSITYAGGGGGGGYGINAGGSGGSGGGGTGQTGSSTTPATAGTANTGGGGGGAGYVATGNYNGAAGGSGIVIISYAGSQVFNGGLVTSSGGNTIHTFTSSGALTPLTNNLNNSLRFRASASAYLSRTPTLTGNRQTFTYSFWTKRGALSTLQRFFGVSDNLTGDFIFQFDSSNRLEIYDNGPAGANLISNQVFRDISAWYHIVIVYDTTNATTANRVRMYVNGNQVTSFASAVYPAQNTNSFNNQAGILADIGIWPSGSQYYDGYMADINFIDGQALEPYYFGNNDANGVWKPIQYKGTYGTNGFYLNFATNQTSAYVAGFNGSSQYLTTPSSSAFAYGSSSFTQECWVFLNALPSTDAGLLEGRPTSTNGAYFSLLINSSGQPFVFVNSATRITGTALQTGTWYHVAYVRNSATNIGTLYINGISQGTWTDTTSYLTTAVTIAKHTSGGALLNSYITNIRIVNGTAVYTSNFTPPVTGLTAITNTQLLTLQNATIVDNSTNAFTITNTGSVTMYAGAIPFASPVIGADYSPNANNWLAYNMNTNNTAVTSYDVMTDVPTNTSATVANYAVMNPLELGDGAPAALSNGNLTITGSSTLYLRRGTMNFPTTGKYYCEFTVTAVGSGVSIAYDARGQNGATQFIQYNNDGTKNVNGTTSSYGASFTTGDVIALAVDADGGNVYFYKNNTSQGAISLSSASMTGVNATAMVFAYTSAVVNANFGQRPFAYTPPTGYVALNTYNLPTPTILQGNKYMDATLYTGNGSTQVIVNQGQFQPDLVWDKARSNTDTNSNMLVNSTTGRSKSLSSNQTSTEGTSSAGYDLVSFNSNGFTVGPASQGDFNTSGWTFVGWQWKANGGTTTSNTSGSITSTVQANTTAGFSIVTYTGTGANATVGHGLGVAPAMIITRYRGVESWSVYHKSLGGTKTLYLDLTNAANTTSLAWNNTDPTSTVFSVGSAGTTNTSGGSGMLALCWAEISGYSKFGSYTGNGSTDGPFVFLGFRPKFVMTKRTDSSTNGFWNIYDSSRNGYNDDNDVLYPNSSSAEDNVQQIDLLSNGFKLRNATYPNTSGGTYIYAAFAENPFKNSNAR